MPFLSFQTKAVGVLECELKLTICFFQHLYWKWVVCFFSFCGFISFSFFFLLFSFFTLALMVNALLLSELKHDHKQTQNMSFFWTKKKKRRLHPGYFRIWGVRTAKPQADLRLLWSVEQMQRSQSRGERQNNVKTSWSTTWSGRLRCGTAAPPQTCTHRPHLYSLERYIKRLSALGFLLWLKTCCMWASYRFLCSEWVY